MEFKYEYLDKYLEKNTIIIYNTLQEYSCGVQWTVGVPVRHTKLIMLKIERYDH